MAAHETINYVHDAHETTKRKDHIMSDEYTRLPINTQGIELLAPLPNAYATNRPVDDDVDVCVDCYTKHHEGHAMPDTSVTWTDNTDSNNLDDDGITPFSSSPCGCCGTTLGGYRYRMATWTIDDTDNDAPAEFTNDDDEAGPFFNIDDYCHDGIMTFGTEWNEQSMWKDDDDLTDAQKDEVFDWLEERIVNIDVTFTLRHPEA